MAAALTKIYSMGVVDKQHSLALLSRSDVQASCLYSALLSATGMQPKTSCVAPYIAKLSYPILI